MNRTWRKASILFLCAFALLLCGLFARKPISAKAEAITIEDARSSAAPDLVTAEPATASANLRDVREHTVTYENGVFSATTSGTASLRSAKMLQNRYLNSGRARKDGQEVATSQVTSYFTAKFRYSESPQNSTIGILFGKRAVENKTRYYGLAVSPTQKVVFVYTFDGEGGYIGTEQQGPLSYDQKDYTENTDYLIELLIKPEVGIDVYVGGECIVENCATVYETNDSLIGLTPVIGLNWFDVSGTLSEFSLKYLDAEVIPEAGSEPVDPNEFTLEGARTSEAENVVAMGDVTATDNFRYKENYGILFEDGKFTTAGTNTGSARAAMLLKSNALDSELVEKDGQEVPSNQATYYISVDITVTAAQQDKTVGTLIGKRENERSVTWYAIVVSYSQKLVFIYAFETDMSGNVLNENQGEVSHTDISMELGQKYTLEALVSPVYGLTAAFGGVQVCRNLGAVTVYPANTEESLLGLIPVIGLSWFDLSGSAENFILKYLDAEVIPEEVEPPHAEHVDEDNDGFCDFCGETMPNDPNDPNDPDDPDDPGINTDPIVPDVEHPENPNGCGGMVGIVVIVPAILLAVIFLTKRRRKQ